MNTASQRVRVIQLYRQILRLGRNWKSKEESRTEIEKLEILTEARQRFRENRDISDPIEIGRLIYKAEQRIVQAEHYGIPYERPEYLPPDTAYLSSKTSKECQENDQQREVLNLKRLYFSATKIPIEEIRDIQTFSDIICSEILEDFKIRRQYQTSLIKNVISKFEKLDFPIPDEIYDKLGELMGEKDGEIVERVYLNHTGDEVLFSIEESSNQLSKGTTGLSIWQASCDLANLCQYLELESRTIIELGAGCGLTGISIAANFPTSTVYLTDYNEDVLNLLEKNVKKNGLEQNCHVKNIDWCNFTNSHWHNSHPDLIIAADVVYDTELLPSLTKTIAWFLEKFPKCAAIIACTLRNPESLACFEKNIGFANLKIVEKLAYENGLLGGKLELPTTFPFSSTIQTPTIFYSLAFEF